MQGRVCVVTGASSGIGKAAALGLARLRAHVVLVCRNQARADATQAAIREATGNTTVDVVLADLSSQAEIHRLAQALLARYPQLHVLINNAGVLNWRRAVSVDGIESVFAVNHLAYFLLTNLLLERLAASAPARVINVASDAHTWAPSQLDDLQSERRYQPFRVYGQSKLCNILFTRELARRLDGTRVTVNAVHPGGVATGLGMNNGWWATLIAGALKPFILSPEQGADTVLYLATAAEVDGVTGKYFEKRREQQPSRLALDDGEAQRLWRVSADLTGVGR
jgi:NAD(P)-dependent dehydrogenase (short-subunit alcohol dehydrogenase family)